MIAPRSGVPVTVMPRPRRNSSRPSSRSSRSARSTVFVFTPSTVARSFAGGKRSPGFASPSLIARRISAATCLCSSRDSLRSTLTPLMVLARIASSDETASVTTTISPDPLDNGTDHELEERVAALEALNEETRPRARRRRQLYAAAVIIAIAAGAAAYLGHGRGGDASLGDSAGAGSPNLAAFRWDLGRWGPSHGPDGGWVPALAINPANPQVIYAGGWGNVFKSSNGGRTWKDVTAEPWGRG